MNTCIGRDVTRPMRFLQGEMSQAALLASPRAVKVSKIVNTPLPPLPGDSCSASITMIHTSPWQWHIAFSFWSIWGLNHTPTIIKDIFFSTSQGCDIYSLRIFLFYSPPVDINFTFLLLFLPFFHFFLFFLFPLVIFRLPRDDIGQ
jgi:hypothetical protein